MSDFLLCDCFLCTCVQECFVSVFHRNVLPLHLDRLLSLCVCTGLLDLWTLCPQRTFHSGSLGGGGMGEACRTVPQLHIPWCGEITFKFIESIFFFAYLFIFCFCLFLLYFSKIILCSSKFIKIFKSTAVDSFLFVGVNVPGSWGCNFIGSVIRMIAINRCRYVRGHVNLKVTSIGPPRVMMIPH